METVGIIFVMGVSGCGKTTVGKMLAGKLSVPFFDGDDYHPEANIIKMRAGKPLDDSDRCGWLKALNRLAIDNAAGGAVIACSALKKAYRKILFEELEGRYRFVYLEGSYESIMDRLGKRQGHFMPAALLKSQFEDLEEPDECIRVPIEPAPAEIAEIILEKMGAGGL